jgi:hypothetical protein
MSAADVDWTEVMEAADVDVIKLMQVVVDQITYIQKLTRESLKFIEVEKLSEEGKKVKKLLRDLNKGFSCVRTQARKDVESAADLLKELSNNEEYARADGLQEVRELENDMKKIVAAAGNMKSQMDDTKTSVEDLMDKTQTVLPDTSIWLKTGFSGLVAGGVAVTSLEIVPCCGPVGALAFGGIVVTGGWLALATAVGAVVGWLLGGAVGFIVDKYKEIKFGEKLTQLQGALKEMLDLLDVNSKNIASLEKKAEDGEVLTYTLSKIIVRWKKGRSSWEKAAGKLKEASDAFDAMGASLKHADEDGQGTWFAGKQLLAAGAAGAIGGVVATCLKKQ